MFFLKSDEHLFKIRKELYEDATFSDLTLVADGATFHGHSHLIFQQLPGLARLVCDGCKYAHDKTVIYLPGVKQEFIEIALLEFYIKGDPTKLRSVLNVGSEASENDTTKNADKSKSMVDDGQVLQKLDANVANVEHVKEQQNKTEKTKNTTKFDMDINESSAVSILTADNIVEEEKEEIELDLGDDYLLENDDEIEYHNDSFKTNEESLMVSVKEEGQDKDLIMDFF